MIRRIDHVIAIVGNVERTSARLLALGCPLVWDGRSGTHRDVMFSIGPVKLELLAVGAFDGWPALAALAAHTDRSFGVRVVALDPGDLDETVAELRQRGIAVSAPQDGGLHHLDAPADAPPIARWRNAYVDGLRGLLPGLPSFLCQILAVPPPPSPLPSMSAAPDRDVPIEFVELRVGVGDPARAAAAYESVLGVRATAATDGSGVRLMPLADTPIRLVPGGGIELVVALRAARLPADVLDQLAAELPGFRWA